MVTPGSPQKTQDKSASASRPIPGYIFAYDSISLKRILTGITRGQKSMSRDKWIDGIFVLKKGHIVPGADGAYKIKADSETTLLSLYLTLWKHLILTRTPPIRLDDYFPSLLPHGKAQGAKR